MELQARGIASTGTAQPAVPMLRRGTTFPPHHAGPTSKRDSKVPTAWKQVLRSSLVVHGSLLLVCLVATAQSKNTCIRVLIV